MHAQTRKRELADGLAALASAHRLSVLGTLSHPLRLREIRVHDESGRGGNGCLARQTIRRHLATLMNAGLVIPAPDAGPSTPVRFVVNRSRLVALSEDLRDLAARRPGAPVEDPAESAPPLPAPPAARPCLVLMRGVNEGRSYALSSDGPWTIGRSLTADISLDWDRCVDITHARIARTPDGYVITDEGSHNGVHHNMVRAEKGALLTHGDVLCIGRSMLVFWS